MVFGKSVGMNFAWDYHMCSYKRWPNGCCFFLFKWFDLVIVCLLMNLSPVLMLKSFMYIACMNNCFLQGVSVRNAAETEFFRGKKNHSLEDQQNAVGFTPSTALPGTGGGQVLSSRVQWPAGTGEDSQVALVPGCGLQCVPSHSKGTHKVQSIFCAFSPTTYFPILSLLFKLFKDSVIFPR